ncbi:MAG: hypothetical protein ACREBS_01720, partial [Nitrososphaerales archaeon]
LVLIHLFAHCSGNEAKFLRTLLGRRGPYSEWEIERARSLLTKYDSAEYAQKFAFGYIKKAEKLLFSVKQSKARDRLLELSTYLAMRKY